MYQEKKRKNAGFTLIELIVVVAILGFLLSMAIPRFMTARGKAALEATKANLHNLASALELAMTEKDATAYPDAGEFEDFIKDYIPNIPKNPQNHSYTYEKTTTGYRICDPDYNICIVEGGVFTPPPQ